MINEPSKLIQYLIATLLIVAGLALVVEAYQPMDMLLAGVGTLIFNAGIFYLFIINAE